MHKVMSYLRITNYVCLRNIRIFEMRKGMSYAENMHVCETSGSLTCARHVLLKKYVCLRNIRMFDMRKVMS